MGTDIKSKRKRERLTLSLPAQIYCRESLDFEWNETTEILDITPFGAGFTLSRRTEVGRILQVKANLPRQLRRFDYLDPQYKIWGVVRHSALQPQDEADSPKYRVGVAFIGKRPPQNYKLDPSKRYDIVPSQAENGMWLFTDPLPPPQSHVDFSGYARRESRYMIQETVTIEVFDMEGNVIAAEQTITEDISRQGACVLTTLGAESGRFVRMSNLEKGISATAIVRNRRKGTDNIMRLHLEIIDLLWPIEGVD